MDKDEVISTLNDLIETCKDGEYGFRSCAEHADSSELVSVFNRHAEECLQAARELQEHVVQAGGSPDTGGTASGAVHRGWVAVRSALSSYDDLACSKNANAAKTSPSHAIARRWRNPCPSRCAR